MKKEEKTMTWKEMWIDLGRKQVDCFTNDHETYLECIVKYTGIRDVMMMVYRMLLSSKMIQPLEDQHYEGKLHVWETAKEIAAGRMDKEGQIQLSKVLYTIEYYLNK
jgi:hypothetical protein